MVLWSLKDTLLQWVKHLDIIKYERVISKFVNYTYSAMKFYVAVKKYLSTPDEEEEQLARKREERRLQSLQRKHERKLKHDEIRKKYGLLQDSDNPYSRFENE
ncbi:hypothetical protein Q9233_003162 [Columba guinea]|nr:hypothetical protein Q9233_003162 [Columba guinea]